MHPTLLRFAWHRTTSPDIAELFALHVVVKALVTFIFSKSAEPFFAPSVRGAVVDNGDQLELWSFGTMAANLVALEYRYLECPG